MGYQIIIIYTLQQQARPSSHSTDYIASTRISILQYQLIIESFS
jgi:hypothetical protein